MVTRTRGRAGSEGYVIGGGSFASGLRKAKTMAREDADRYGYPVQVEDMLTGRTVFVAYPKARKARNPGRMTKAQRSARAKKASVTRRVSKALKAFLHAQNPKAKYAGARIRKNPGGTTTIIPIKLRRAR